MNEKDKNYMEMMAKRNLWRNKCIEVQEILDDYDPRDMSMMDGHEMYRRIQREIKQ